MKVKNLKTGALFILISLVVTSCGGMPEELEARKKRINERLDEINSQSEKASTVKEYEAIKVAYMALKDSVVSYTSECNKKGIEKNNDEVLVSLDNSIKSAENKISEISSTLHIGTWSYSEGGINYQIQLSSNGRWSSQGFQGYNSGTWSGDANSFEIFDHGILSSRGRVREDGETMQLQTGAGTLDLEKID